MTPEQMFQLRSKEWLLRAKAIRPAVSRAIAEAIGKPPSAIVFADREETDCISAILSKHVLANKDIEFPNRHMAVEFVTKELRGTTRPAFLLWVIRINLQHNNGRRYALAGSGSWTSFSTYVVLNLSVHPWFWLCEL
jgi:hypothetical protein